MIFEVNSDSGGEAADDFNVSQSLPNNARPTIVPVLQHVQQREDRERTGSVPGVGGVGGMHERSPSLPVAPTVNVEEVDATSKVIIKPHPGLAGGRLGGHVKANSGDWTRDMPFGRKGSPSDFSYDSDSSESPLPVPSQVPNLVRVRTSTMDSDTLALSMLRDGAMPMIKQGSELSDTGSLIVPSVRGMTFSDDSAEEGDLVNQERKLLYLMVARCIAYPFNAKYQLETAPPKPKLNEDRLQSVIDILETCRNQDWDVLTKLAVSINNAETKCLQSERFLNCLDWYMDNVLDRGDVVTMSKNGSFSVKELESIFKVLATKHIMYTSSQLDVDSTELQTWCSTFRKLVEHGARTTLRGGSLSSSSRALSSSAGNGGGTGPNKEKLYKLFQKILEIKSLEHQILYRVCQV